LCIGRFDRFVYHQSLFHEQDALFLLARRIELIPRVAEGATFAAPVTDFTVNTDMFNVTEPWEKAGGQPALR
jgi:hypothetical protein